MIQACLHEGSVIYDVGAHVGAVTFGAARLAGSTGCVVAFDVDPENIASLQECCRLNHYEERIRVVHTAVWSSNKEVAFRRGLTRRSHGGVMSDGLQPVRADGEILAVTSTTLDAFIASQGPTPDLIKIDVEGGEYEVLRGGEVLFKRDRPRVIIEVHHEDVMDPIEKWIEEFRYKALWSVPPSGFPRMLFAWPSESPPIGESALALQHIP
jgi:FkbM family methyltransferase